MGGFMLKVRSRSGVVGVTAGAAALLALPVVAAGQVPVVDQVVGGVTQTAQSLAPPPAPALPAGAPALPAPAAPRPAPATPAPASSAPTPAPRQVTATGAPGPASAGGGSARGGSGAGSRSAEKRSASGVTARAAQSEADAAQSDDSEPGASRGDGAGTTDVEIADGEAGDDASPGALPFTGFQLVLLAMIGLGAIAGGAALRRVA
jgi:hypothetical protein